MHLPTFKISTIRQVWLLIQWGDYAFLLIWRMLIYIFLLLSINIAFYGLFGTTYLITGRFCLLGWPQLLEFSPHLLNPCCCFAIARVCMSFSWMMDWFVLTPSMLARQLQLSYAPLFFLGLHINFSKSDLHLKQQFSFVGLYWNTVDMSFSLPSTKLDEIQKFAHALLQRQPVTVHQVMSFLSKTAFCANGHAHLCQLCLVVQSDMLNVYHCPANFFLSFCLFLPSLCQLQKLSLLWQSPVPLQFPLPDVVITTNTMPHNWAFYIQGS